MRGKVAKRINELVPVLPKTFTAGPNTPRGRRLRKKIWMAIPRSKRGKVRFAEIDERWGIITGLKVSM